MEKHLIYVPYSEYISVSDLCSRAQNYLVEISKKYDLQPFSPHGEPLNISFSKNNDDKGNDVIVITIEYFVFNK
jgi:hypothetical protein